MRQHLDLSKADLVEQSGRSATLSDEMTPLTALTTARTDENIVESGFDRYIAYREFR
jgi:hypothetical protein